ncbi:cupredoxin domain-containing protein [Ferviditalea candida]|uniref:Cupredoxin domain-containing protein n=1 Tax=Ferviditalea candida TaxID=3108399 RepID=A0ABU5ZQV8_9BACL|nr:cupredoxin domain-containing protein [Paenibacillaceae bacterium T2]
MKRKYLQIFSAVAFSAIIVSACGGNSGTGGSKEVAPSAQTNAPSTKSQDAAQTQDNTKPKEEPKAQDTAKPESAPSRGTKEITITATNFKFDQTEIHVKKGDKIKLTLKNENGVHGLAIPDFGVKIDGSGTAEFVADKAGSFDFNCSVLCGPGHDGMVGKLIVEE